MNFQQIYNLTVPMQGYVLFCMEIIAGDDGAVVSAGTPRTVRVLQQCQRVIRSLITRPVSLCGYWQVTALSSDKAAVPTSQSYCPEDRAGETVGHPAHRPCTFCALCLEVD